MNPRITPPDLLDWILYQNSDCLVIFDLDDTIFNTVYRRFYIYNAFLRPIFKLPSVNLEMLRNCYDFLPYVKDLQLFQDSRNRVLNLYHRLIYSGTLLWLDKPFAGVASFVTTLRDQKIPFLFLTGRTEAMRRGTISSLRRYQFVPFANTPNTLLMKPTEPTPDNQFKKFVLQRILKEYPGKKLMIIDNESLNCQTFNQILPPEASVIRFNSVQKTKCPFKGFILETWA